MNVILRTNEKRRKEDTTRRLASFATIRYAERAVDIRLAGKGSDPAPPASVATWLHTFYDQQLWTTPGGDFEPSASAARNVGWIILGEGGEDGTAKRFDAGKNPVAENRPRLTVTFTPPDVPFKRGDRHQRWQVRRIDHPRSVVRDM